MNSGAFLSLRSAPSTSEAQALGVRTLSFRRSGKKCEILEVDGWRNRHCQNCRGGISGWITSESKLLESKCSAHSTATEESESLDLHAPMAIGAEAARPWVGWRFIFGKAISSALRSTYLVRISAGF